MFNIGPQELLVILVIALVVVGPRRLPELGRSLGKGLREIRRAQDEVRRTVKESIAEEQRPAFRDAPERGPRGAKETATTPVAGAPAADETSGSTAEASGMNEVSRTLGRSLAELRRAREEIQRTLRADLDPSPKRPPASRPRPTPPPAIADAPEEDGPADGSSTE